MNLSETAAPEAPAAEPAAETAPETPAEAPKEEKVHFLLGNHLRAYIPL
jgi:hypothetical protein